MTIRSICAALSALLLLASCAADHSGNVAPGSAGGSGDDWLGHVGDGPGTGYSRLDQIDTANIAKLGLAFSLDLPGETTLEGTPLAVGGVLYFSGTHAKVYAVDGQTGKLLWSYDPQTWKFNPFKMTLNFGASRGIAYAAGKVFVAAFDGRLISLDAKSGAVQWSTETLSRTSLQWITGAPYVAGNLVVVGQSGADMGERGFLAAYDLGTGKQVWRFYTVPGSPQENAGDPLMTRAAATWYGEWWKNKTGGGPWGPVAYDEKLGLLYLGSANPGQVDTKTIAAHKGDQLFSSSIIALDARTGKYKWHYQVNPRDVWDYGANTQITLADLNIGGKVRKVLMQAPKNGFLYVVDRESGQFISAGKIVKVTWADRIDPVTGRPVEARDIRFEKGDVVVWPNPTGGHNWHSQSFSPKSGLIYIPAMHNGVRYSANKIEGGVFVNNMWIGSEKQDARDGTGSLVAWDPVRQQEAWRIPHKNIWNGGVLATGGNLLFQGDAYGQFVARDALSGDQLWSFDAGLGIIAPPISYGAGGKQYVAVLVGWGGAASIGSDVMDGKAAIPPGPKPTLAVNAVDDPALRIDSVAAEAGKPLFLACALCHGRDVISSGSPGPDLRESALALDQEAFLAVVKGGALLEKGMPRYDYLSREQALQVWHYVRSAARKAKQGG
jgi:quinohemoprotein ethanol dehydrogenase